MELSDHKVFVVGGSRGIGAAIVRRFSAAGATAVFTYAASGDAASALAAETGAQALRANAGERDMLMATIRDAGPIDIFVYVAALALYLAGTQARGITGAMHTIDGGFAA